MGNIRHTFTYLSFNSVLLMTLSKCDSLLLICLNVGTYI